jgi:NitT/TauT family transport system ATP-binding protein
MNARTDAEMRGDGKARGASGSAAPFLSVKAITKVFRDVAGAGSDFVALDNVSFEARAGEFISVVGPSGCGKSTLLFSIAGLETVQAGRVIVNETEVRGPYHDVGLVFQDAALLGWRTALQNIMLQAEVRRLPKRDLEKRARALLEMVGLTQFADHYPDELSGGMRQRVSICRALVHSPNLVLMDEPFGALDAFTREKITLDLERIWAQDQKTIVFVTHDIEEACFLADRVIVMRARPGKIHADIAVDLPRPRSLELLSLDRFQKLVGHIRRELQSVGAYDD